MNSPRPSARLAGLVILSSIAAVGVACVRRPAPQPQDAQPRVPVVVVPAQSAASPRGPTPAPSAPAGELPLQLAPRPTTPAISEEDLKTRIYIFADDSMLGRMSHTEGNVRATNYIEREVRRLGLQPAGDSGTYFQSLPPSRRMAIAPTSAIAAGGTSLTLWSDFAPMIVSATPLRPIDDAQVIFGGTYPGGIAITAEQAGGKFVVLDVPTSSMFSSDLFSGPLRGAAAIALVTLERMAPSTLNAYRNTRIVGGQPAPGATAPAIVSINRRAAEALLGAPLQGMQAGTAGTSVRGRIDVSVQPTPLARNVIAVLPGSDPALRGQYVALGAHSDHVGTRSAQIDHDSLRARLLVLRPGGEGNVSRAPNEAEAARIRSLLDSMRALRPSRVDTVNNGADDDGSGSMALLEIAEAMTNAREKPRRSILFVWHTAEESGLVGARHFTDNPTVPRDSIVAQINIDMIGRGTAQDFPGGGPDYLAVVGSRRLSTQLGDLVEAVNTAQRRPLAFDYSWDATGHGQQIYCRSDHAHYARYGIPVVFFFTGLHPDYHMPTDEAQYLDYPHYTRITQFIHDLTLRTANLDQRPLVDKPKPDPSGQCRQ